VIVTALKPVRGSVSFSAENKGAPVEGVGIWIDGEPKGSTDAEGKAKVEWLLAGNHSWRALHGQDEVSQGEFCIAEITEIQLVDMWIEVEGREGEKTYEWHPLTDTVAFVMEIKNTGTTVVDHWTWSQTSDTGLKVDLLHPKMPAKAWRPFAGNLLASDYGRDIVMKGDKVEAINPTINSHQGVVLRDPIGEEGLKPGETAITEEKKVYTEFLEEAVDVKSAELGTKVELQIVDRQKGFMDSVIAEYKFGPITFHDMRARTRMKGQVKVRWEVSIDGQAYNAKEVTFTYL